MLIISHLISSFNLRHHGIHIVPGAKIGPGLRIEHPVGIVIGEKVVIGADCTIMQGTTMGVKYLRREKYVDQYPTIGDKVTVGANSVILGNVHIGNRSEIGAQSLVLNSAPDNSLIIGCPARNKHRDE